MASMALARARTAARRLRPAAVPGAARRALSVPAGGVSAALEAGDETWYAKAGKELRFRCTACGKCCTREGVVNVNEQEVLEMSRELGLDWREFGRRHLRFDRDARQLYLKDRGGGGSRCTFLGDDNKCEVYRARPTQCRTYPWWPAVVESEAAWEREAEFCEGIGNGDPVPLVDVEVDLAIQTEIADAGEPYTYEEAYDMINATADEVLSTDPAPPEGGGAKR